MQRPGFLAGLIVALGFAFAGRVSCAEQVTVERDTPLRAGPSLSAQPGVTLKQGAKAEVTGRSGAWINVRSGEDSGWLFMFNVRYGERQPASAADSARAAGGLFGGRSSPGVVSTIGIRGLSEEDLQKASFNPAELKVLDGYAASKDAAEQQARVRGLTPVRVDYLEAP